MFKKNHVSYALAAFASLGLGVLSAHAAAPTPAEVISSVTDVLYPAIVPTIGAAAVVFTAMWIVHKLRGMAS